MKIIRKIITIALATSLSGFIHSEEQKINWFGTFKIERSIDSNTTTQVIDLYLNSSVSFNTSRGCDGNISVSNKHGVDMAVINITVTTATGGITTLQTKLPIETLKNETLLINDITHREVSNAGVQNTTIFKTQAWLMLNSHHSPQKHQSSQTPNKSCEFHVEQ